MKQSETKSYIHLLEESFPGIKNNIKNCEALGFGWGEEGRLFIKEENNKVISHVGYFESSAIIDGRLEKLGALHAICTSPAYQNRGFASELILEALKWAKDRCSSVLLYTEIPAFYERLAFNSLQEYRFHLPCKHRGGTQTLRKVQVPKDTYFFIAASKPELPYLIDFGLKIMGQLPLLTLFLVLTQPFGLFTIVLVWMVFYHIL